MKTNPNPLPSRSFPEPKREIIHVSSTGVCYLPDWVWKALLKRSRIRSRKHRIQKKAVKREFQKLLWASLAEGSNANRNEK